MTIAARPTVYNGVQMRSRLEARVASLMDRLGWEWQYEPRAYKSSRGEYLPDFQIGRRTFIEVKGPYSEAAIEATHRAVRIMREAEPTFLLWVVYADGFCMSFNRYGLFWGGRLWVCRGCDKPFLDASDVEQSICSCGDTRESGDELFGWPR